VGERYFAPTRLARHGCGVFAKAIRCVGEKFFAPTRLALHGRGVFAKATRCVGEKYFAPTRLALHGCDVFAKAIRCVGEKYFAPTRLALHGCDVFAKAMHCRGEKFFALPLHGNTQTIPWYFHSWHAAKKSSTAPRPSASIRLMMWLPITATSARPSSMRTCSGREMPNPAAMGRPALAFRALT